MQGSAEFLAPETRIVPTSGLPPRITNLSIIDELLLGMPRCPWCSSVNCEAGRGGEENATCYPVDKVGYRHEFEERG